jgi:cell division GTPase FtsZ
VPYLLTPPKLLTYDLNPDANVIWGTRIDNDYAGKAKVTAIIIGVEPTWVFGGRYEDRKGGINLKVKNVGAGSRGGIGDIIPIIQRGNL